MGRQPFAGKRLVHDAALHDNACCRHVQGPGSQNACSGCQPSQAGSAHDYTRVNVSHYAPLAPRTWDPWVCTWRPGMTG